MISTNDVRPGMALELDDGLFTIVEYQHVKPGKGKAFVRMKLKNWTRARSSTGPSAPTRTSPRRESTGRITNSSTRTTWGTTS
jgi:hypothetical protein